MVATPTPATPAENALREGLRLARIPEPCALVIFGASGDLTRRKLLPALYNLAAGGWLPAGFSVIGAARHESTDVEFRGHVKGAIDTFSRQPAQPEVWGAFSRGIFYVTSDFQDPNGCDMLRQRLDEIDQTRGTGGNRVFYLATPPSAYPGIIRQLGHCGLNRAGYGGQGWARIIVEKPFGHDLASARALNRELSQVFAEDQIYRIDHYLGKETVQNLFVLRFANGIFEPLWNRRYVDHVQITVAETVGVENRAGYYERAGALRDMVQSHMLQLLTLVGMEPPVAFDAEAVRDEKVKVLRALRTLDTDSTARLTVRGQYGRGRVQGQEVPGYREEPGVATDSITETYVALTCFVDNWRWAGVPFYLRTGKRLPQRVTEIAVQFQPVPHQLFQGCNSPLEPNILTLHIQPDDAISLSFLAKRPGASPDLRPVRMEFPCEDPSATEMPEAYERLLLDCMLGDSTLFTRCDEVEAEWAFIDTILRGWSHLPRPAFPNYAAGTWGPSAADTLIERDGRRWLCR